MSNSIKKNYIYNLFYQILLLLTPLITTPYISRVLGAGGIGIVSYAESNVTYFVLFATMGISFYGQREISYVQHSVEKRSAVFWNTKILSMCTTAFALLVYLLFAVLQKERSIYFIFTVNLLSVAADVTWFFQGMEEFGKIVLRNVIVKILSIAYVFVVIQTPEDVFFYAIGHAIFPFLSNLSLWFSLPRYIQKPKFQDIHPFQEIKEVFSLFLPTVAIQIYTVLDKTMIGIITQSSFENGYYEQTLKISKMVLPVVTALGTVMIPRIGYHFERHELKEVKYLMLNSYRFVWFMGVPLTLGLIGIADNFVPWFFGPGYEKVSDLISILAFLILAIGISNVTGVQYLVPTKKQKYLSLSVMLGAMVNFTLNLFLIKKYGSIGAALASVAAEVVVAAVQIYFVRKELSALSILRVGVPYCFAGMIMFAVIIFLEKTMEYSIMHTIMLVICGAVVYFAVLIAMGDEFLLETIKKLRAKLIRE